ncbi:unnamed protein product [Symbiodinium natans]|uniref:PDZ domain-containing protein n=1 Tax=Symbiodinium natans TaxID=878477 RepID=A0A812RYZ6_9DINO|nr:unnamed protein product [Symbiodinium natans]
MAEEDEAALKPNRANAEDEFLRHPGTGAFYRNPLREKADKPILMSLGEYEFNCLDDALNSWHCVSMPESMFRKTVLGKAAQDPASSMDAKQKAALRRLDRVTGSYEYVVTVRKSQFVPPRGHRRHAGPVHPQAVQLEKLVLDVVPEMEGYRLRVEYVGDGLVAAWNRANPCFAVRPGDYIVKVDGKRVPLQEAIYSAEDVVKLTMQRVTNRSASKASVYTADQEMTLPGETGN